MAVALPLEHMADRQDRAAQVAEHDHAIALVCAPDRVAHERIVGAKRAIGTPACDLDPNLGTSHLACEFSNAAREICAMRDNYDANQKPNPLFACASLRGSLQY
jgi:hypothetical protein